MNSNELVVMIQGLVFLSAMSLSAIASAPPILNQLSMVSSLPGTNWMNVGMVIVRGITEVYQASLWSKSYDTFPCSISPCDAKLNGEWGLSAILYLKPLSGDRYILLGSHTGVPSTMKQYLKVSKT